MRISPVNSPVYRILAIHEVLSLVAEELKHRHGGLDTSGLASLARTCRGFCSPALDVLWRSQSGLRNIIKCMPADLWEIEEPSYDGSYRVTTATLRRAIRPDDWDRFNVYAPRIRELSFGGHKNNCEDVLLPEDVCSALSISNLSMPLFPNLRNCSFIGSWGSKMIMPDHRLLLGDTLCQLSIVSNGFEDRAVSFLAYLPLHCPNLQKLVIGFPSAPDHTCIPSGVFSSLTGLRSIRILQKPPLPASLFAELQSLPQLVDLSVVSTGGHCPVSPLPPAEPRAPPSFRALKRLILHGPDCAAVLEASFFPVLEKLDIQAGIIGSLGAIFSIIHDHCSHASLHTIEIARCYLLTDEFIGEPAASADDFKHLYIFHQMKKVSVKTSYDIFLTDADLRDMALAWPSLEYLRLLPSYSSAGPPSEGFVPIATLCGLAHFAWHCPKLSHLYIGIDTSPANPGAFIKALPRESCPPSAVSHLALGCHAPFGNPAEVAFELMFMFPKLEELAGVPYEAIWFEALGPPELELVRHILRLVL
ncbi:hypothetical protein DAEQUDRAFT_810600 [Daedalea quercina L-15889]|uniref:F-box domain-containing protein n=1 Tax=Daedalea quercina L-15889 TaxID=1314783 RepID=A0A165R838_9APHY|nr:hypothetical protein DAEQUDRAFT_810600 [Daedalea quercina L-15889]